MGHYTALILAGTFHNTAPLRTLLDWVTSEVRLPAPRPNFLSLYDDPRAGMVFRGGSLYFEFPEIIREYRQEGEVIKLQTTVSLKNYSGTIENFLDLLRTCSVKEEMVALVCEEASGEIKGFTTRLQGDPWTVVPSGPQEAHILEAFGAGYVFSAEALEHAGPSLLLPLLGEDLRLLVNRLLKKAGHLPPGAGENMQTPA